MHIIKNDDQKFKTLRHIQDFQKKLSEIRKLEGTKAAEAFLRAYGSHIGELRQQVREYQKLKQRKLPAGSFSDPTKLGSYFVRARIAVGVTQEALAQKLGVSQPMVHKYELSEYAGCGLDLLTKVAEALGLRMSVKVSGKPSRRVASSTAGHHGA